ncbi:MAG TPA: lipid II flippase MurJ [Bryobacteraceae bacterium]|nr:lipid II flippase MurJ [Bryobacteraceae bacterium]
MQGGLVVGAGILLGNITGFFRVALIAYLLGTRAHADALAVATGPIDTFNSVLVNTMLFAFVPMLMLRREGDRLAVFARSLRVFGSILAAASLAVIVFASPLAYLLGPGLSPQQHQQTETLVRLLAPSMWFAGMAAVFSALLYTERRFLIPGLYQVCLNGTTIVSALVLWKALGIYGFAIGYTAGACLQLAITWFATADMRREVEHAPIPASELLTRPGMFLLYAGLIAANVVVTRAFATHAGSGMAAAFDYTMRCVNVVVAYLVYPAASTLVPEIARLRGKDDTQESYRLIGRGLRLMAVAALVATIAGILLRTPVMRLIFEHGNFTAESTKIVSGVFLGLAPSLLGWALMDLTARCLFALDRPKMPLLAATIPITVNVAVSSFLRAEGKLTDPVMLGVGASMGLLAGFAVLVAMIQLRRRSASLEPEALTSASQV